MGFFSSRRHDIDAISSSPGPQSQKSSSSPGIIRSRFVRMNAAHIFSCVLILLRVICTHSTVQYGRNKSKTRDTNLTPPREVATPLAESKKQPSPNFNDTPRTPNGYHSTGDNRKNGASELPLHSPTSQKAPRSPSPATVRASTDATTHVAFHSHTHTLQLIFFLRVVLAQRLAELASANADGLLEYVALMESVTLG